MQINIQFLRFLAALSVVLFHTSLYATQTAEGGASQLLTLFSWFGYAGVDVFFVISGYIMWTTTRSVQQLPDVGYFLYKRAARIYLGYWPFCLLMLLMLSLYTVKNSQQIDYLGSIFLTRPQGRLLLTVAWTLTFELYFYVVFAVVLLMPSRFQFPALAAMLALVLLTLGLSWGVDDDVLRQHARWVLKGSRFFLSPFCAEFIAGCLLAVYFEKRLSVNPWLCGVVCLSLVSAALWYQQHSALGTDALHNYPQRRVAFFGTASLVLVALMVELEHRGLVFFKRASLLLGGASYSLYLCHVIILRWFHHAGLHTKLLSPAYSASTLLLLLLVFIIGYSVVHYLYIEKPLMSWARKMIPANDSR